jgi:hypothetical protein
MPAYVAQSAPLGFSVTVQRLIELMYPELRPLTVACSGSWPLVGIVAVAGETDTVTLLGLNPLPVPQPAETISRTNART